MTIVDNLLARHEAVEKRDQSDDVGRAAAEAADMVCRLTGLFGELFGDVFWKRMIANEMLDLRSREKFSASKQGKSDDA